MPQVVEDAIPPALAGERIDRVVALLTGRSRAEVAALIAEGRVLRNGEVMMARATRVESGDVVRVELPDVAGDVDIQPEADVEFSVVHEDLDVVVVDKPAGLVVHPGAGHASGTLVNGLLERYPEIAGVGVDRRRPGVVHRLDRDTSGLLVVARSQRGYDVLVEQLRSRSVERVYLTLAWGSVEAPAGLIDGAIGRSRRDPKRMAVSASGKSARTEYSVERRFLDPVEVTLLRCRLQTGRTHQIRVHLQSIGHPVVGDPTYDGMRQSLPVPRLFLHATRLGFAHPVTGVRLEFESPLPPDLAGVLARLS
ncbi:MAG: RluA family pseudouridine synthase [Acidimicrobiales bacterium]|nr:RluA family pseudouridine synthase [Acidimicrobiales bacterium]